MSKHTALYHLTRVSNRRSIRVENGDGSWDNVTREFGDSLMFEMDPQSDLKTQIRDHQDQRREIAAINEVELRGWTSEENAARGESRGDYQTADQRHIPAAEQKPPATSGQIPKSNDEKKCTQKQINFLAALANRSEKAKEYINEQMAQRGIGKAQLPTVPAKLVSIWIDNAKQEADREASQLPVGTSSPGGF